MCPAHSFKSAELGTRVNTLYHILHSPSFAAQLLNAISLYGFPARLQAATRSTFAVYFMFSACLSTLVINGNNRKATLVELL